MPVVARPVTGLSHTVASSPGAESAQAHTGQHRPAQAHAEQGGDLGRKPVMVTFVAGLPLTVATSLSNALFHASVRSHTCLAQEYRPALSRPWGRVTIDAASQSTSPCVWLLADDYHPAPSSAVSVTGVLLCSLV